MPVEIKVRGFQSIRNQADITVDGFTCLTGESNRGKSAFLRSVKAALSNRLGNDFITVGEESCETQIKANGHQLTWEKSKRGTVYNIDGKEFTKVGRAAPEELSVVGIREITTQDKKKFWPQIQEQQDPYFIVGEPSPSTTAELIGANQDAMILTRAIRLAKEDASKARALEELLQVQLTDATAKLQTLAPHLQSLDQLQAEVAASEKAHQEASFRLNVLEDLKNDLARNTRFRAATATVLSITAPVAPDPDRLLTLTNLLKRHQVLQRRASAVLPTTVPELTLTPTEIQREKKLTDLRGKWLTWIRVKEATTP